MKEEDARFLERVSQDLDTRESHDDTFYFIEMYDERCDTWIIVSKNLSREQAMEEMSFMIEAARSTRIPAQMRIIEMRTTWTVKKEIKI